MTKQNAMESHSIIMKRMKEKNQQTYTPTHIKILHLYNISPLYMYIISMY